LEYCKVFIGDNGEGVGNPTEEGMVLLWQESKEPGQVKCPLSPKKMKLTSQDWLVRGSPFGGSTEHNVQPGF
jgi:hypothetical protein